MVARTKFEGAVSGVVGVMFAFVVVRSSFVVGCYAAGARCRTSMAWAIRFKQVSEPRTSRVSKSGGAFLRPQTATRIGWNNWPVLIFISWAAERRAESSDW